MVRALGLIALAIVGGVAVYLLYEQACPTSPVVRIVRSVFPGTWQDEIRRNFGTEPFDSNPWIAAGNREDALVRLRMLPDLVANVLHRGMTRAQVQALLGPERPTDGFVDFQSGYLCGPEYAKFWVDLTWLFIDYDSRQRLRDVVVRIGK